MQRKLNPIPPLKTDKSLEAELNDSLNFDQSLAKANDKMPVKLPDLKRELNALRHELHSYRVQNEELNSTNRDLNAKLSRLQNTIDNLQRTVREHSTQVLDEMFFGIKK